MLSLIPPPGLASSPESFLQSLVVSVVPSVVEPESQRLRELRQPQCHQGKEPAYLSMFLHWGVPPGWQVLLKGFDLIASLRERDLTQGFYPPSADTDIEVSSGLRRSRVQRCFYSCEWASPTSLLKHPSRGSFSSWLGILKIHFHKSTCVCLIGGAERSD